MTDKEILKQMLDNAKIKYNENKNDLFINKNNIVIKNDFCEEDGDIIFCFDKSNDNMDMVCSICHRSHDEQDPEMIYFD